MSEIASDADGAVSSLASRASASNNTPALSELSPRDKPWDKHRHYADQVEAHYRGSEFSDYATRVHYCAELLQFGLVPEHDDTLKLKLRAARFCRVRHCPVCSWRRSLMYKAKAYKVLPKIVADYGNHRWIFLTLTCKNVQITDLRETLTHMNRSFQRLSQRKIWPAIGWLRSTEVTRGKDGSAHPHFHCLLLVQPGYFAGKNYINQAKWVQLWRDCMRLDYNPILDCRAVRKGQQPMQLIPELVKYCTKESDLVCDREWFLELTRQMHQMRCFATGGVLKQYLKELERDPDDLIGEGDELSDDLGQIFFGWGRTEKKYRMVDK